jgi:hypothetical protein
MLILHSSNAAVNHDINGANKLFKNVAMFRNLGRGVRGKIMTAVTNKNYIHEK